MLSIVITHYKSPVALKLCVRSIAEFLGDTPHEVFVSDSEAQKATGELLRHDFPAVQYIPHNDNVGYARLVNAGLERAKGDYLLVMNADTVLTQGAVQTLMRYLDEHADVGMVGPRLEYMNGKHQPSCFRYYAPMTILARRTPYGKTAAGKREIERFLMRDKISDPVSDTTPLPVDWIMGSVMLARRKAYDAVGPMDTRYFMYMEDVDWCRRFWEAKWKVVWVPAARVVHVHGKASKKRGPVLDIFFNKLARVHFRSAIKYFRKFGTTVPRYGV
jgi:GT2 family glycosyltransferase